MTTTDRNRQLARIHCLKRDLSLDENSYEDILWTLARVRSAKDLDATGRTRVITHLVSLARRTGTRSYPGKPRNARNWDRDRVVSKIEALLTEAGRPWAYAKGMAKRMFGKEALEFCDNEELDKLMVALIYDQKRRDAREKAAGERTP
jgi:phage gp16-like protein